MDNQFYGTTEFGFEVIGICTFQDMGFLVTVRNIRLSPETLTQLILAEAGEDAAAGAAWAQRVFDLMGASRGSDRSASISHVLAEICTVVTMERITADVG